MIFNMVFTNMLMTLPITRKIRDMIFMNKPIHGYRNLVEENDDDDGLFISHSNETVHNDDLISDSNDDQLDLCGRVFAREVSPHVHRNDNSTKTKIV